MISVLPHTLVESAWGAVPGLLQSRGTHFADRNGLRARGRNVRAQFGTSIAHNVALPRSLAAHRCR
jgi:hypothetical protein